MDKNTTIKFNDIEINLNNASGDEIELNSCIKKYKCPHYYINEEYDDKKSYCWAYTDVYQGGLIPQYETCEEIKNCPIKSRFSKEEIKNILITAIKDNKINFSFSDIYDDILPLF